MKRANGLLVGLALTALAAVPLSTPVMAQESGVEVWSRTCGRCHRLQPPTKYDADRWKAIVGHMALNARLTPDEEEAVREFLMGAARPLAVEPSSDPAPIAEGVQVASTSLALIIGALLPPGDEIYQKQCAACHGAEGRGDGPAAVALTPRPADLADRLPSITDEELLEVLTNGTGTMPGFGKLLAPEDLDAVLRFIRSLTADTEVP